MPFQSEKQRRYLHANHPEIAKRWERDYANGGITLPKGPAGITSLNGWGSKDSSQNKAGADISASMDKNPNDPGWGGGQSNGGGGGPPSVVHKPKGPTPEEIAAAKAKAEAEKRRLETEARQKHLKDFKKTQKKKKNIFKKWKDHATASEHMDLTGFGSHQKKGYNFAQNFPSLVPGKVHTPTSWVGPALAKGYQYAQELGRSMFDTDRKNYTLADAWKEAGKQSAANIEGMLGEGLDKDKYAEWMEEQGYTAAKGGVARKNYYHGGILDINESEEIISDDGNDIELTAYNAEFDDPNDLSTGVKSLFRAKNGGSYAMQGGVKNYLGNQEMVNAPKHWKSAPDHPDTELTYITKPEKDLLVKADLHGSLHGSVNKGPSDIISLNGWGDAGDFDGPSSSTGGGAPPGEKGGPGYVAPTRSRIQDERHEDFRQQQLKDIIATGPGSDEEKHDTDAQRIQDTVRETTSKDIHDSILDKHAHRFKSLKDLTLDQKARWAKDKYEDFKTAKGFMSIAAGPFGWLSAGKAVLDAEKRKKETLAELEKDIKTLTDLGYPTHHHTVDTLIQSLNQEILDMTQPKDQKDTGGDGPEPIYTPLTGEVSEEYAQGLIDPRDWMAEIRARQAAREAAVPDWQLTAEERELKNNPIVMTANRGGLANLFRVKNQ